MMSDYRLYVHRNSYAMTTHLLLEELGIEFETIWFNVHQPDTFPEEFLKLNPNAKVPVLVTPHGPVYETAATLMYLSEHHDNQFMPTENATKRAKTHQWLIYLMSTLQPEVLIQFNVERYFPDDVVMQEALKTASRRELEFIWRVIDDALTLGPYFIGEQYTICDILFLMQAIWTENQPADLSLYPNVVQMMRTALKRPAVQRILEIHDIQHLANLEIQIT
jgi:glutathione S-transferase